MTGSDDLPLVAEFPRATREQWEELVRAVLKGAPYERLIATTNDGVRIAPLQEQRAHAIPVPRARPGTPWLILQRVDQPDPECANAQALHDLASGANGLSLVFRGAPAAYGYGLAPTQDAIARVLDGVRFDSAIGIDLDAGRHASEAAAALAAIVQRQSINPAASTIRFGFDPIGAAAVAGGSASSPEALLEKLAAEISGLAAKGFPGPFAAADGRIIHNAGGSEGQELGFALAVAVAYLRALEKSGIALDAARAMIFFRLTADADQFLSLAKLRALRKTWARIEVACGLSPAPVLLAADTAWRMMSKRDPHVNMVRTCIAVTAAGLGGADAITALPFTMPLGLPDHFARRIARNTQLILIEEAHLAKVMDAAAGSGATEDMTDQLCCKGWAFFQEIERAGGAWAALERGDIQKRIAAVRAERQMEVASQKAALIGTSDFPNLAENPVPVMTTQFVPTEGFQKVLQSEPIPTIRLAEPFEALRDRSDEILSRTRARPKVFLAKLGKPSDFSARGNFAKNLFEAGGIEAVDHEGAAEPEAIARAFSESGAKLACLCSSDNVYARDAAAVTKALHAAGAAVWLAGKPMPQLEGVGVSGFIYAGCDILAALRNAYAVFDGKGKPLQ
ncbi:MAG: methylmalonyl-CoA mutase family protein [Xanthobacteraceae bacterium]|jgi:methylmalonyl-CoA mutase